MTESLALKNDVQPVTQLPQSQRQVHDVLSAAESVPPILDSEVTCGPVTRPATLSSSATSLSNSTDFSSSSNTVLLYCYDSVHPIGATGSIIFRVLHPSVQTCSQTLVSGWHWNLIMSIHLGTYPCFILYVVSKQGGSVAKWLACWTHTQYGPGSNHNRDAVG